MATTTTTLKRNIKPVTLTLTVVAKKVNENGTFSSFEIQKVTGISNATLTAVSPPQAGGAIYFKVATLEGVEVLSDDVKTQAVKAKLF
jgi:hypothetical protein